MPTNSITVELTFNDQAIIDPVKYLNKIRVDQIDLVGVYNSSLNLRTVRD